MDAQCISNTTRVCPKAMEKHFFLLNQATISAQLQRSVSLRLLGVWFLNLRQFIRKPSTPGSSSCIPKARSECECSMQPIEMETVTQGKQDVQHLPTKNQSPLIPTTWIINYHPLLQCFGPTVILKLTLRHTTVSIDRAADDCADFASPCRSRSFHRFYVSFFPNFPVMPIVLGH